MADVDAVRVLNAMTERMGRQFAVDQREIVVRDILIEDLQKELGNAHSAAPEPVQGDIA